MEHLHIARVRKIAKGKTTNGVTPTVNIIVVDTTNGKPSIVRNYAQFLQDLKNSFLIDENINSINHPQVTKVLRGLKRGMVSGEITYGKKGDTWVVTEDSRVITDPTHPEFGSVKVGDKRVLTDDNSRVEGFLDIEPNEQFQTVHATAEAVATAKLALAGAFEDYGNVEASPLGESDVDNLPKEIMDEVIKGKGKGNKNKDK